MNVLRRARGVALAAPVVVIALASCNDDPPGNIQCLESVAPTTASVAAGSSVTFTVSVANPDDDDATAMVVDWVLSGGGVLDQAETTITLIGVTDEYGNPAGTNGTTTNTFHATGPAGTYTLQANVLQGGGCLAESLTAIPIEVTGTLPEDGGTLDGATESGDDGGSGADEAGDDATSDAAGGD